MNRRNFFTLSAGAILSSNLLSGESQSQQSDGLKFTRQRTGEGPFRLPAGARPPHMLLISADMVSPDLYHPARPVSKHIRIPNIQSLMADGQLLFQCFLHRTHLCSVARFLYDGTI